MRWFRLQSAPELNTQSESAGTSYPQYLDEPRLLKAAKDGDRAAFDVLRHRYDSLLTHFICRRTGKQIADDIIQETWVGAWVNLKKWNGRSRFKAWLFAIAEYKCIDYYRAQARHTKQDMLTEIDGYAGSQRDAYADIELQDTVQALLSQLPENQKEVLEMYYYDELTLPEIAELLKRNLNTVKYQFYRAHTLVANGLTGNEIPSGINNAGGRK